MQFTDKATWKSKLEIVRNTAGMELVKPQGSTAFIPGATKSHLGTRPLFPKVLYSLEGYKKSDLLYLQFDAEA